MDEDGYQQPAAPGECSGLFGAVTVLLVQNMLHRITWRRLYTKEIFFTVDGMGGRVDRKGLSAHFCILLFV